MDLIKDDNSKHVTAEEVAEIIIKEMMESGRWEQIRVNLASILNVNRDYEKVKEHAQEILSQAQMKLRMKQPTTTEYDIAATIEKQGGLDHYKTALIDLLNTDTQTGNELQQEIYELVENYILHQQS